MPKPGVISSALLATSSFLEELLTSSTKLSHFSLLLLGATKFLESNCCDYSLISQAMKMIQTPTMTLRAQFHLLHFIGHEFLIVTLGTAAGSVFCLEQSSIAARSICHNWSAFCQP